MKRFPVLAATLLLAICSHAIGLWLLQYLPIHSSRSHLSLNMVTVHPSRPSRSERVRCIPIPAQKPIVATHSTLFALRPEPLPSPTVHAYDQIPWNVVESPMETTRSHPLPELPHTLPLVAPAIAPPLLLPHSSHMQHLFSPPPSTGFAMLPSPSQLDISIEVAQRRYRPGFVFKMTCTPKEGLLFHRWKQTYYFLLDRSNATARAHFLMNKQLVLRALDSLLPGDCFNIFLFDQQLTAFSPEPLVWNQEAVLRANSFLEGQGHGGHLAPSNLGYALDRVIPHALPHDRTHVLLLFSDGDPYMTLERQRKLLNNWSKLHQNQVSLHVIASGSGHHLGLFQVLSRLNQGSLLHVQDPRYLKSRFDALLSSLQHPIGTQLMATLITEDENAQIQLQPTNMRLPPLYRSPFTLYGSTHRLTQGILFLQGKAETGWFDIKIPIHLDEATYGSPKIEAEWCEHLVEDLYDQFICDGNRNHLEMAKRLLAPFNLSPPFHIS